MLTDKEQEEIRRKLLGLEEEPPAGAWSKIAAEIQPGPPPGKLNWWLPAILLLLLVGAGVFYFFGLKPDLENTEQISKQEQVEKLAAKESEETINEQQSKRTTSAETVPVTEGKLLQKSTTLSDRATTPSTPENAGIKSRKFVRSVKNAKAISKDLTMATLAVSDRLRENKREQSARTDLVKSPLAINPDSAISGNLADPSLQVATVAGDKMQIAKSDSLLEASLPNDSAGVEKATALELKEDKIASGWFVGATLATRYAFRYFEPTGADEIYITSLNKRKNLDPNRLGYEFGLNVGKSIKENVYLETSLTLMKLREQVAYSYTTGKVDTLLKTKTSDGSYLIKPVYVTGERELKSDFMYGGLRLGLTYFFLNRAQSRFNITVAAGANLLVKGRTEEFFNGEYLETISFPSEENLLEQTNYNLLLGAGYNVSFRKNYELMVMPSLNYFLGSTYAKREPFGLKPYTMGINFQVRRIL